MRIHEATAAECPRVLRITSHVGKSRYMINELGTGIVGWIPRVTGIPSPYAYSATHCVYRDPKRGHVIIVETSHKRYDVFRIPADVTIYDTDDDATKAKLTEIADTAAARLSR